MEKQQEKKVKKFDIESYRILAELSQSVIFEWEIESDRIYVSDNWNLIFGSKPAADNFSSNINKVFFLYPDSHDFLTPYIEKIKKKNKFLTRHYEKFELRLRVKTGKYLWFQL
ncbi:hypothetical protein [Pectinatus sottacetonis]|uniref:hypothetical protein n=1 Tax=Pectinatus sottacetonis TaxID=1002795 RepID=UPI0018C67148|nr:hypothetical protein [Pectinatus sottacetonis]